MPGGFQFVGGQTNLADQGTSTGTSNGTTVTAGGTNNTKGSYAQLVAATTYDANAILLQITDPSSTGPTFLVDLAVGPSGSEQVIVPNMVMGQGAQTPYWLDLPIAIKAGSRIAMRCQASTLSTTFSASVILKDGNFDSERAYGSASCYGFATGNSYGVSVDPGATGNTKGAWSQITAATTSDIGAFQLMLDTQRALGACALLIDVGIGPSGSEQVIVPNIAVFAPSGQLQQAPRFDMKIKAGSRLAVRAQSTITVSGTRKFGASIMGYNQ